MGPLFLVFLLCVYSAGVSGAPRCTGGNSCCTEDNKCGEGEGDCDYDNQCLDDLSCFKGGSGCIRGSNFDHSDSCCVDPKNYGTVAKVGHKILKIGKYIGIPGTDFHFTGVAESIVDGVWDLFGRRRKRSGPRPPSAPLPPFSFPASLTSLHRSSTLPQSCLQVTLPENLFTAHML